MIARIVKGVVLALGVGTLGAVDGGCLSRPAIAESATTKVNFVDDVHQAAVDKIDILFAIDNSASMGDKQAYLAQAVPDLIARLVTPNCVDPGSGTIYGASDASGSCTAYAPGAQIEFPPVHDMHVGIVSTSLGERGGDQCPGSGESPTVTTPSGNTVSYHFDDRGELLSRSGDAETPLADAGQESFLEWFPTANPANAGKSPGAGAPAQGDPRGLAGDFADLVTGVAVYGCGIESQLESWYRFLVQPDPYDQIVVQNGIASWQGVDRTILQQRHDFLRPDSLVAVVVLTDENDSEIDVRALGGRAWNFMSGAFQPLRGSSACATNPADPACVPCGSLPDDGAGDPSCDLGPYTEPNDWGYNTNLRHVHMKAKYGYEAQFPIERYVLGLSSPTVPDRSGEYPHPDQAYAGLKNQNCTNPLFAASLPDGSSTDPATLCNLPKGTRSRQLVFYAHIGGVPHQLLQQDPTNPDSPQKDKLAPSDWVKILGQDPQHYDYTGIDPHMVESYQPRPNLPPPSSPNDADPIHGRELITNVDPRESLPVDREYACTFAVTPRDCTDPANLAAGCDCRAGLSPEDTPPVCDTTVQTSQVRAKAYPTTRELLLGNLMGDQGVISSLCPIHTTDNASGTDPLYGYRPAMSAIVARLKTALASTCVPQPLLADSSGSVPCLVLVTLPEGNTTCDASLNMQEPASDVLRPFLAEQHANWMAGGGSQSGTTDPSTLTVCQIGQLTGASVPGGTCAASADKGWCYVTGAQAGVCQQGVLFSPGSLPTGAIAKLQCIEDAATAQ